MERNIYTERIDLLREEMKKEGISLYIVLTDDDHASEYVSEFFKEREWLTGFTGSNGTLAVTETEARLWTDGRYFLQAEAELSGSGVLLMKEGEPGVPTLEEYMEELAAADPCLQIAYDGCTMNVRTGKFLRKAAGDRAVFRTDRDIPGELWEDRPEFPNSEVWFLGEKYRGETTERKLERVRAELEKKDAEAILITALDEIAWLYNMRASDIAYTPVRMAYSIVTKERAILYMNSPAEIRNVEIRPYFSVYEDVKKVRGRLLMDEQFTNETLWFSAEDPVSCPSQLRLMKAVKTGTEAANEIKAHIKDGLALTRTVYWLKKLYESGEYLRETELSVEKHLTEERKSMENFLDLSFGSIVAMGEHGAIVHYEATEETSKPLEEGYLLLDTGAHYLEGTTDVTRTVSLGPVTREMKNHYTAVLKGHLDISSSVFPEGTKGSHLDALARRYLWAKGLDYKHGTGHGVGYILCVHEGPNSLRRGSEKEGFGTEFLPGMITSNEPGLYLEGQYGIRIENLILTKKAEGLPGFLSFRDLTMVPYDRASIDTKALSPEQLTALRRYSDTVYETLSPYLEKEERDWLRRETRF